MEAAVNKNGKAAIWTMCRPCAEGAKESYEVKELLGRSEKITCAVCGRRRYGSRYVVALK